MKHLVPEHKFDLEAVECLNTASKQEVLPLLPELLMWLQDINWPVAQPVLQALLRFHQELVPHIRAVFDSNDDIWKCWTLCLVTEFPKETIATLLPEIRRIAEHPTASEQMEEADEYAQEVLQRYDQDIKIRTWCREDSEQLAKLMNNQKVQDNLRDGIPFPYTVTDAQEYIAAMRDADPNNIFAWAIVVKGELVGSIGIFRKDNVHRLTAEMGYYLGEEYWGRGITSEAVRLACAKVFETTDIVRIFAEPFATNTASCRVLEKAGFQFEGILKKNVIKNGKILDMRLYAIVKE